MSEPRVSVEESGAIRLAPSIVADGFNFDCSVRVQSHLHSDHMGGFDESKGNGRIVCSKATRELLIAIRGNDLKYRSNFIGLEYGEPFEVDTPQGVAEVSLLPSGHMLGAAQVAVTTADGYRTGYSGDFAWPIDDVLQVDELVVDATYGHPDKHRRRYTQEDAEARFVDEALRRSKLGPLVVYAHRGTLQRAIACLDDVCQLPLLGSPVQRAESAVHAAFGLIQAGLIDPASPEGQDARASGKYIEFVGTGDPRKEMLTNEHRIKLSASITQMQDPYLEITPRYCRIALTDHADFDGTMEYIARAKPSLVLTDASRSPGHAIALAEAVHAQLGIDARPLPLVTIED